MEPDFSTSEVKLADVEVGFLLSDMIELDLSRPEAELNLVTSEETSTLDRKSVV